MNRTESIELAVVTYRNFALHQSASARDVRAAIRRASRQGAILRTIQRAICTSGQELDLGKVKVFARDWDS